MPFGEVIDQKGHTKSVDWWGVGVLLCELLAGELLGELASFAPFFQLSIFQPAGHAPFHSKTGDRQETYGLVKRGIETVHFPSTMDLQANRFSNSLSSCSNCSSSSSTCCSFRQNRWSANYAIESLRCHWAFGRTST